MRCVYCGAHWSPTESDYLLATGFGVERNEDPVFCDSLCKRHFAEELRRIRTAELSMEDLLEEVLQLFPRSQSQEYIELSEDLWQLTVVRWTFEPVSDTEWLVTSETGEQFRIDDAVARGRKIVLYHRGYVAGTIARAL